MAKYGTLHIKVALYHPSFNGLAERAAQTFKEGMKKCDIPKCHVAIIEYCFSTELCR